MTDPAGAPDAGADAGAGATGAQTPEAGETAEQKRIRELEAETAQLREERRTDRATALGAQHGLTPTMTEMLAGVPADQQEAKAKQLAEEIKTAAPAPSGPGGNPPPAPVTQDPPADPAVDAMGTGGSSPAPATPQAPSGWSAQMEAEIKAAEPGDFEAIKQIQEKYQRISREAEAS